MSSRTVVTAAAGRPSSPVRTRGPLLLALAAFAAGVGHPPVASAADYYVYLDGPNQGSGPTPVRKSLEYVIGQNIRRAHGAALPGSISGLVEVESHWIGVGSDGTNAYAQVQATTQDFVISGGPDPAVTATLYFQVDVGFSLAGGFPLNGAHGAGVEVSATANGINAYGAAASSNNSYSGTGVLAGSGPFGGGATIALTGTFPVGSPFQVFMGLVCNASGYGNGAYSPGLSRADMGALGPAGVRIGDGNGAVMQLPGGYTVNSPSWGVVNNTVVPVADVPAAAVPALAFEPVVPNPSASDSRLAFALAAEGDASLAIFDVQGREVRSVARGRLSAGRHEFVWDGRDGTGRPVTAGIYFAVAQVGGARSIQRVARTR